MEHYKYLEVRGYNLYKRLTKDGKAAISKEVAATLSNDDLKAIIVYIYAAHLDFERDLVAYDSLQSVLSADLERNPLAADDDLEMRDFFKMDNDELGIFLYMNGKEQFEPTCDNCRFLDNCPAEYKQEQPNYCENWEQ